MDTNRLRYFCTVVKTKNLHRASEILNISVPALSKSIKVLEYELDKKLLIQVGRGIEITDVGLAVARKADKVLVAADELFEKEKKENEFPVLRLGSFEVFTTYFLGSIMKDYFKDYALELLECAPGHLENALVQRVIDYGITYIPIPHPDLDFLKVTHIEMAVFGRPHFKKMPLSKMPFVVPIIPVEGSPNKIKGLDGWPDHEHPRLKKYKVTLMESAMELCRHGLAVAYLPKFVVDLHNKSVVKERKLVDLSIKIAKQKQDVFLIKRKSDAEGVIAKKLSKVLRLICS
ncbi:MAG: LysR family transcriptional regulator [Deltaproteobacteria bacterium]|nr:LysR family transcriptional regulator [Deltaproteobacteria bacterium]